MGPKQSNIRNIDINHPQLEKSKVFTRDKVDYIETLITLEQKDYEKWRKDLKITQINKEFLLLPQNYEYSSASMCSQSGTAKFQYPHYSLPLMDQIQDRGQKEQFFEQTQLWYLLYALASAKESMRPKDTKVGDIRPQNIFLNEKGHIKVANMHSWPLASTNFSKSMKDEVTYLAPEELTQVKKGHIQNANNAIAQTFSIGLTVLSAAILEDNSDIYDLKSGMIKENELKNKLDQFKLQSQYSDILKSTVSNLCKIDPAKRMVPEQLWKILNKHQKKIKKKENFQIDDAPEKLHNEFKELKEYLPLLQRTFAIANIGVKPISNNNQIARQTINYPNRPPPILQNNRQSYTNSIKKKQSLEPVSYSRNWNEVPLESPVKKI